ncbi:hypothetical protein Tco_0932202 [Tanacetum coccineum]
MSSITAQQTKLDLELVSKENRLDIRKCNGRIPQGLTPREPTFQVVLDAIALTLCYPTYLITADVPKICPRVPGRDFDALPSEEDTMSFLRELGHTGRSIHSMMLLSIRCINPRELLLLLSTEVYLERLVEDFIYQIENRVYKKQEKMYYPRFTKAIIHNFLIQEKTLFWRNKIGMHTSKDDYLINSLRFISSKESTQIYGAILPECLTSPVMKESKAYKTYLGYATDEEPIQKGKRVKRPAKKSTTKPAADVIIREAYVETKSKIALTEEAQMKEVRKKSLRDFHKTHPSGSGMVSEKPQSVDKITPTVTSEGTGDKPGVPDVTEDDSTISKSESWGNDEDKSNNEQESSNEGSEQENESDEQESNSEQEEESEDDDQEEEEFVHTPTDDKDDDNLESKKPTQTDKEVVQDAHVTISTVTKKTEVPVTSSSRSSDLASKFLNFLDIPHADAEIVSPLDVYVHHEVPRTQAYTLLTIPVSVITESSPVYTNIPQSSQTFTPPPILTTPNPPPIIETTNPLSTLPDFATSLSRDEVTLAKVSSQTHSTYEAASTLTEFELKKILINKIEKSKSYLAAPEHRDCYDSLKKYYDLNKDFFFSYDVYSLKRGRKDKDKDEDPSAGSD